MGQQTVCWLAKMMKLWFCRKEIESVVSKQKTNDYFNQRKGMTSGYGCLESVRMESKVKAQQCVGGGVGNGDDGVSSC